MAAEEAGVWGVCVGGGGGGGEVGTIAAFRPTVAHCSGGWSHVTRGSHRGSGGHKGEGGIMCYSTRGHMTCRWSY